MRRAILIGLVVGIAFWFNKGSILAAADRTPPVVTITNPIEGSTIGDGSTRMIHLLVQIKAIDENNISSFLRGELYINDQFYSQVSINPNDNTQYMVPWDIRKYPNGKYLLEARITDARGNVGTSQINFTLNNGAQTDFTGPSLQITSPADGSDVKRGGQAHMNTRATDSGTGMNRVEVYVTNQKGGRGLRCSGYTSGPDYPCSFWVKEAPGTTIKVESIGYDWESNSTTKTITLNIKP